MFIHDTVADVVRQKCDLIFIAVQTPHDPRYSGATPMPAERKDFDYTYLCRAVQTVNDSAVALRIPVTMVVISTVLPGTCAKYVLPVLQPTQHLGLVDFVYSPMFIAMSTVMKDTLYPEFVLVGGENDTAKDKVFSFFRRVLVKTAVRSYSKESHERAQLVSSSPRSRQTVVVVFETSIASAEAIKVFYNTWISTKLAFVNTIMEACDAVEGADVDEVTSALGLGHQRIISTAYMRAGMGDGGACHPRDNIALSWFAREHFLNYDFFACIMESREASTKFLASLVTHHIAAIEESTGRTPPVYLYGAAFKANTDMIDGSPALLLRYMLKDAYGVRVHVYDPMIPGQFNDGPPLVVNAPPAIVVLTTCHDIFTSSHIVLPHGSVIIDPWRVLNKEVYQKEGVSVISVGSAARAGACSSAESHA